MLDINGNSTYMDTAISNADIQKYVYQTLLNSDINANNSRFTYKSITVDKEDLGTEEWVWVTGYKGTDKDMKCRDYQFEMGKQFDMPEGEKVVLCHSGFHFCDKLDQVFRFYPVGKGNRFFEVKALVRRWKKNGQYTIEQQNDKMTSKSIEFVRELTADEIFEHYRTDLTDWTTEQKKQAMETSVDHVAERIHVKKLMDLGYSEAFAIFAYNKGAFKVAHTMGTMPDVSMDVKVLTVAMDIYE